MSDIEKLAMLAEQADELLALKSTITDLSMQLQELKDREVRVLTTKEAAKILGVTSATVVNWCNRGMIPAIMSKNGYKIPSHRIFALAEKQAEQRASMGGLTLQV